MTDSNGAVLVEARDKKLFITLNRPEVLNAQDTEMRQALNAAFDRLDEDDDLVVAIMRGAGRAFSAGADMKEGATVRESNGDRRPPGFDGNSHFHRCDRLTKPIIAVIHGYAMGGGLEIALCCDLRIATADARLGTPEARTNGGMPGIAVHRLAQMIPTGEALKIMYSSQPISGERAYDIGLVQDLAEDIDSAMALAEGLANQMIECNPTSLRTMKRIARWPLLADISTSMRFQETAVRDPFGSYQAYRGADFLAQRRAAKAAGQRAADG
jgi:enoyl-CoA hydratase/carnithine racemase